MTLPLSPTIGDEYTEDGLTRVCVGVSPNRWISKRLRPPLFTGQALPHADARAGDGWTDPSDGKQYEYNGTGWIGAADAPELLSDSVTEPTNPAQRPRGFVWWPGSTGPKFHWSTTENTWIG
jgi:hypothetical protein